MTSTRNTSLRASGVAAITICCLLACSKQARAPDPISLEAAADAYLGLVLALGTHDPSFVVSYYGSPAAREAAEQDAPGIEEISRQARQTVAAIKSPPANEAAELSKRRAFLQSQLMSVAIRADMLGGTRQGFMQEAASVFDMTVPDIDARQYITELHAKINRIMPGQGLLSERIDSFRKNFIIPKDRLASVFEAAVKECRERTRRILDLPEEKLEIEYASGVNWLTHHEYRGNGFSVIKINTDLPIYIDRAVDMGCHEGYPGHHVSNVLKDAQLVQGKGWKEFTVQTLFSPQTLIEEGIASFAVDLIFPGDERVRFERDVLFDLAGFDRAQAYRYLELMSLSEGLAFADIEGARRYLDGEWDAETTVQWLINYRLLSAQRARQRLAVFDAYRSFIATVYVGKQLVADHVRDNAGEDDPEAAWKIVRELLVSPVLPSDLRN